MAWCAPCAPTPLLLPPARLAACPPSTEWVVVTNGDNVYDSAFVEELLKAPVDADVVAVDFYSRYQRPTGRAKWQQVPAIAAALPQWQHAAC